MRKLSMIGTTSSGTLMVLFGMYVLYVHINWARVGASLSSPGLGNGDEAVSSGGQPPDRGSWPFGLWLLIVVGST